MHIAQQLEVYYESIPRRCRNKYYILKDPASGLRYGDAAGQLDQKKTKHLLSGPEYPDQVKSTTKLVITIYPLLVIPMSALTSYSQFRTQRPRKTTRKKQERMMTSPSRHLAIHSINQVPSL